MTVPGVFESRKIGTGRYEITLLGASGDWIVVASAEEFGRFVGINPPSGNVFEVEVMAHNADVRDTAFHFIASEASVSMPYKAGRVPAAGNMIVPGVFESKKIGTGRYEITLLGAIGAWAVVASAEEFGRFVGINPPSGNVFEVEVMAHNADMRDAAFHFIAVDRG